MNNPPELPAVYIMMSDQHPSSRKKAIWVDFLGRGTACLHGADHYARKFDYPVYYMHIRRVKRGYYEASFDLIHASPSELGSSDLIQQYMGILEQEIKRKPSDWLWSHRRWKYNKD
jgi:KDO2-lipid IV(A) lauroyltransferase